MVRAVEIAAGVGVVLLSLLALTVVIQIVCVGILGQPAGSTAITVLDVLAIPVSIAIAIAIRRSGGRG